MSWWTPSSDSCSAAGCRRRVAHSRMAGGCAADAAHLAAREIQAAWKGQRAGSTRTARGGDRNPGDGHAARAGVARGCPRGRRRGSETELVYAIRSSAARVRDGGGGSAAPAAPAAPVVVADDAAVDAATSLGGPAPREEDRPTAARAPSPARGSRCSSSTACASSVGSRPPVASAVAAAAAAATPATPPAHDHNAVAAGAADADATDDATTDDDAEAVAAGAEELHAILRRQPSSAADLLGGGWRSAVDDLGREYYWDPSTEATSWERPNAIPAPPLGVRRHEVVAALETSRGRMVTAAEAIDGARARRRRAAVLSEIARRACLPAVTGSAAAALRAADKAAALALLQHALWRSHWASLAAHVAVRRWQLAREYRAFAWIRRVRTRARERRRCARLALGRGARREAREGARLRAARARDARAAASATTWRRRGGSALRGGVRPLGGGGGAATARDRDARRGKARGDARRVAPLAPHRPPRPRWLRSGRRARCARAVQGGASWRRAAGLRARAADASVFAWLQAARRVLRAHAAAFAPPPPPLPSVHARVSPRRRSGGRRPATWEDARLALWRWRHRNLVVGDVVRRSALAAMLHRRFDRMVASRRARRAVGAIRRRRAPRVRARAAAADDREAAAGGAPPHARSPRRRGRRP